MGKPPGEDLRKFGWVCDCSRVGFAACAALRNFKLNNTHAPSKPNQFRVNACGFAHRPSSGSLPFPSRFTVLRFIMPQFTRQNKSLGRRLCRYSGKKCGYTSCVWVYLLQFPTVCHNLDFFTFERVIHQLQQCMGCIFPVFLSVTALVRSRLTAWRFPPVGFSLVIFSASRIRSLKKPTGFSGIAPCKSRQNTRNNRS